MTNQAEDSRFLTTVGVATPAMAFVAGGAIESGVERAECLVDSPAQCPTNDVLAVEPDMPPPNAVRSHPIVEAGHTIVAGASGVLMGDRIFRIDGVPFWK